MFCEWLSLSMELKVLFSPIVNNYLKSRYPKGIRYNRADNLTIFIFSLFAVPKPGQITPDHPDGVSILLPDQFLHDNRVFIPQVCMDNVSGYVINHINLELSHELTMLIQNNQGRRFIVINACIENFLVRNNIEPYAQVERFKKAFYRQRKKMENNLGSFVPNCPQNFNNQSIHG